MLKVKIPKHSTIQAGKNLDPKVTWANNISSLETMKKFCQVVF